MSIAMTSKPSDSISARVRWIAVGDKHVLVHPQRVRRIALCVRDLHDLVR